MNAQERAAFEAWLNPGGHYGNVPKDGDRYTNQAHSLAWLAWKARAALAAQQVPAGFVLVPVEPTEAMLGAAWASGCRPRDAYLAMLAAAPGAPQPAEPAPRWLTKEEIDPLIEQARDAFYPADMNPHFERCLVWLALRAAGVKEQT